MKKIIALLLAILMTMGVMTACSQKDPASSNEPAQTETAKTEESSETAAETTEEASAEFDGEVLFAVATFLTGASKEMGDRQIQAVETAVDKINAAGGLNGQKLTVQYFDAGADQQSAINAIQLAVNTEGVSGIVGLFQSAYAIAYSDIVKDAKIPTMCLGTSYNVRDQKNPYMWQPRVCDETTSQALAKLCIERGMTKPCVMWMTNSSGQSQHDACVAYLEANGVEVGLDIGFNVETETDYTPIVTQFLNSDCDGLILIPYSNKGAPEVVTILNQYGYDMSKVSGVSSVFSSDLTDIVGDMVSGIYGVAEFSPIQDREATRAYVEDFESRSDVFTSAWTDAVTYDAILLLAEGAKLGGGNDPESINNGLAKLTDFTDGALTDYTYYDDHCLGETLLVTEFQGSDIVFTDTIAAR